MLPTQAHPMHNEHTIHATVHATPPTHINTSYDTHSPPKKTHNPITRPMRTHNQAPCLKHHTQDHPRHPLKRIHSQQHPHSPHKHTTHAAPSQPVDTHRTTHTSHNTAHSPNHTKYNLLTCSNIAHYNLTTHTA